MLELVQNLVESLIGEIYVTRGSCYLKIQVQSLLIKLCPNGVRSLFLYEPGSFGKASKLATEPSKIMKIHH